METESCTIYPAQKVLVVGLGKSGISAVKFLQGLGADVRVSESQIQEKIDPQTLDWLTDEGVLLETGGHSAKVFLGADLILVSPGIPLDIEVLQKAGKAGIPVVGELALASRYLRTPTVAVTGTNGKSTVTTLLGCLFRGSGKKVFVGGNIGTPLTDYLAGPQEAEVVVLEVSSFQLDTSNNFRPDVGVLLNISPDHLDRYGSYEEYAASKFKMFAFQNEKDAAVLNLDDPEIMDRMPFDMRSRRYFFGADLSGMNGITFREKEVLLSNLVQEEKKKEIYDLAGTSLYSTANIQNAMAAIMAARIMGCAPEGIGKGLANFKPLRHRMALVAEINKVRYYDDSKATNTGAVATALSSFHQPVILIAGGREKGEDFGLLNDMVSNKVKHLLLIGEAKEKMAHTFAPLTRVEKVDTLGNAVNRAYEIAQPGDIVLLSPACASFDMFSSYGHRGEVFSKEVLDLLVRSGKNNKAATMTTNGLGENGEIVSLGHQA